MKLNWTRHLGRVFRRAPERSAQDVAAPKTGHSGRKRFELHPRIPRTADFSLKSSDLGTSPPILVRYWPDYTNPYQKLFYGLPSHRFAAKPGDAATALADAAANPDKRVCFHVHWLNFLFRDAQRRGDGNIVFDEFLATCRLIREKGGVVAWTIHNLLEHEGLDSRFEIAFRQELARIADFILVHGRQGRAAAIEEFRVEPAKIFDIAHGSYIGVYDDGVERESARSRVHAPERGTIFGNVGNIRPYKGLEKLIGTIIDIEREGASVGLLIAGKASSDHIEAAREMAAGSEAVRIHAGRVDDGDLQNYLNAADFVALPYRSILTSGSAILALSFARPIIAPALGDLVDLIRDGENGFLYDPAAPNGLKTALMRATKTDAAARARMSGAAFARATALRWSDGRSAFIRAIANGL